MRMCLKLITLLTFCSCSTMKNLDKPEIKDKNEGYFYKTINGCQLFVYDFHPKENYNSTIFIISGITGINHHSEKDIIEQLSNDENRIVVIHPRGTGYSDGKCGDISNFSDFINDYIEIITNDNGYKLRQKKIILFGHSMATAILLKVAAKIEQIDGAILINPPYLLKKAEGMSPGFGQYVKFALFYVFAKHKPVVNMAGDPSKIENEEDRKDSEMRINDPLLVKYFSLYMMTESKKIMDSMIDYSKTANYPLLLIYGEKDNIVDKNGCDLIFENWQHQNKQYALIANGAHGKSTVVQANDIIEKWINSK